VLRESLMVKGAKGQISTLTGNRNRKEKIVHHASRTTEIFDHISKTQQRGGSRSGGGIVAKGRKKSGVEKNVIADERRHH